LTSGGQSDSTAVWNRLEKKQKWEVNSADKELIKLRGEKKREEKTGKVTDYLRRIRQRSSDTAKKTGRLRREGETTRTHHEVVEMRQRLI